MPATLSKAVQKEMVNNELRSDKVVALCYKQDNNAPQKQGQMTCIHTPKENASGTQRKRKRLEDQLLDQISIRAIVEKLRNDPDPPLSNTHKRLTQTPTSEQEDKAELA